MGRAGTSVRELCREFGVSSQTLYRHVSPTDELRPDGMKVLETRRVPERRSHHG